MASTGHDNDDLAEEQAAVQAEVARLRSDRLGGRGPGAAATDVLASTRARRSVGGRPVPELRDRVALEAAAARRDPDALAEYVAGNRLQVAAQLDVIASRVRTALQPGQDHRRASRRVRYLRGAALLLVGVLVGRRLGRRGRVPASRRDGQMPA